MIAAMFVAVSALFAHSLLRAEAPAALRPDGSVGSTARQRQSAMRLSIDSFDTVLANYVTQDADAEEVEEGPSDEETESNEEEEASNAEEESNDDKPASDDGRDEALINRGPRCQAAVARRGSRRRRNRRRRRRRRVG